MSTEKKVFISYSRADSAVVIPFVERLQKDVGDVFWIDLNGIESGAQFVDVIIDAIDKTDVVLFMHSVSSLESEWVRKEIQYAQGMKKKIVPILVDGKALSGWFLFQFGGNDFIDPTNETHCNKLTRDLKSWLGITEVAPVEKKNEDLAPKPLVVEEKKVSAIENNCIVVSAKGDGDFRYIHEALEFAKDGMTISVKYGEYHEHFVVDKKVTIVGEINEHGKSPVILIGIENTGGCIHLKAPAILKNLAITSKSIVNPATQIADNDCKSIGAIYITANAILEGVSVYDWLGGGILIAGEDVDPVIKNCSIYKNNGNGIIIIKKAKSTIQYCDVWENDRNVVVAGKETNPYISECKIYNGKKDGIVFLDGAIGKVENCEVFKNEQSNIVLQDLKTNPHILGCKVYNSPKACISVFNGAAGIIENCEIFGSEDSNFSFAGTETNLSVAGCSVHNGKCYGILVYNNASCKVENCDIFENEQSNIVVSGAKTNLDIVQSVIHNGKDCGIVFCAGATGRVESCSVFENENQNIGVTGLGSNPYIVGCKIYNGKNSGIAFQNGAAGKVENCDIFKNKNQNIYINGSKTAPRILGCNTDKKSKDEFWLKVCAVLGVVFFLVLFLTGQI